MPAVNIAEMSDEDFLSMGALAVIEQQAPPVEETTPPVETPVETPEVVVTPPEVETPPASEDGVVPPEDGIVPPSDKDTGQVETPVEGAPPVKEEGAPDNANPDGSGGSTPEQVVEGADTTQSPPDYKAEYEKIMAPFVANGRKIELKTPAEVQQLMQMGANYTRKMQAIAPHRKALQMLENNQLLNESDLSYLIDLKKGDKSAIQKLLKDSGIDPRDIDVDSESTYQGGNHRVSDREVEFQSTVDDIVNSDGGRETLAIAQRWDQASIDAVGNDPAILRAIHEQRATGVYDLVASEVERRRTLGVIPTSVPFLQAYRDVGNELAAADRAKTPAQVTPPEVVKSAPVVVAKSAAQAKPPVSNADKAKAAAASRSTPAKAAATPINVLAQSDEEFMKTFANFQGRL